MSEDYDIVRADFNEIAELDEAAWNHNNCYFPYLLRLLPKNTETCLDIGCGKGQLSGLLSQRAGRVTAVDLSDRMIERARELNPAPNIDYICGNILEMDFKDNSLDLIITTATAHHLPYAWLLEFAKDKLKKGGRLLILDLARPSSLPDFFVWAAAVPINPIMSLIKNGRLHKDEPHARALWERHGEHDTYMKLSEIRRLANKYLPTSKVKRKLFWRYVLIWTKP